MRRNGKPHRFYIEFDIFKGFENLQKGDWKRRLFVSILSKFRKEDEYGIWIVFFQDYWSYVVNYICSMSVWHCIYDRKWFVSSIIRLFINWCRWIVLYHQSRVWSLENTITAYYQLCHMSKRRMNRTIILVFGRHWAHPRFLLLWNYVERIEDLILGSQGQTDVDTWEVFWTLFLSFISS